jgi:hypothetical protein
MDKQINIIPEIIKKRNKICLCTYNDSKLLFDTHVIILPEGKIRQPVLPVRHV